VLVVVWVPLVYSRFYSVEHLPRDELSEAAVNNLILSRRDVDFMLLEWLRAGDLTRRPVFDGQDTVTYCSVLDVYEALARDLFAPHNKKNDSSEPHFDGQEVHVNPEIGVALAAFSDAGLVGAGIDSESGGMALPSVVERAGMAFLLAANTATTSYAVLTIAAANLLVAHGSPMQVNRYVRPMLAGDYFGTMCLSETQAGSSLADIRTRAVRGADGRYRLFGSKMWISAGEHSLARNIVHLVLAKIADESGQLPQGIKGISLFVVPRQLVNDGTAGEANDIALAGINHKMGYRGTVNCVLNFGEGRRRPLGEAGAVGEIIGAPGQGLAYMFHMMNEARISVGLSAAALAYTGYLHALDYAKTRRQGRIRRPREAQEEQVPIVRHADVRRMLLAQKAYASGSLALCLYAARLLDDMRTHENSGKRRDASLLLDLLTPVVKSWPSQWGLAGNDLAIQVHGGYGYTREYNVEQFYRDNRLNAIHEGTFGIQALDLLGRKTRAADGAAMALLSAEMARTCAAAVGQASLQRHAHALASVWESVFAVTISLHSLADDEARLANAAAYLEAFGHVVVAWLWLDQALVAESASVSASPTEMDFYGGKRAACDFFFGWELPKVSGMLAVLEPIERTPLDTPEAWL
jgi:alkylation response protein AidB-like acyl-CoA dehydrogenase